MSHLWLEDTQQGWAPTRLEPGQIHLSRDLLLLTSRPVEPGLRLLPVGETSPEGWLLLWPTEVPVRVNGLPFENGARLLRDRDEFRIVGSTPVYFSSESLAEVQLYPGSAAGGKCPRCKQAIETDCMSVRCPACHVWHHQSSTLPCWTYADHCALCDQPTALDHGYRWTPVDSEGGRTWDTR